MAKQISKGNWGKLPLTGGKGSGGGIKSHEPSLNLNRDMNGKIKK